MKPRLIYTQDSDGLWGFIFVCGVPRVESDQGFKRKWDCKRSAQALKRCTIWRAKGNKVTHIHCKNANGQVIASTKGYHCEKTAELAAETLQMGIATYFYGSKNKVMKRTALLLPPVLVAVVLLLCLFLSGCMDTRQIPRLPQDMPHLETENCVEPHEMLALYNVDWRGVFGEHQWSSDLRNELIVRKEIDGCKKVGYCAPYNWNLGQRTEDRVARCLDNDDARVSVSIEDVIKIVTHLTKYYWGKLVALIGF